MKETHFKRRNPACTRGFNWARIPMGEGMVSYRLFRRDCKGMLHMALLDFRKESRLEMAASLKRARHKLRDRVDDIDLSLMGVTNA